MKNIAIIDKNGERKTTYEELERLSDKIKNKILSLCIKEDSILPICMKDSMEYIASEIGAIKAGYAFAPINIDYPKERIEGIIKECKSSVIIDENFFAEAINADILIEVEKNKINNKALVIFTSGSTGKPKGVYHTYSSFNESVLRHIKMLAIDENDNYLLLSPFNFIASIKLVFLCVLKKVLQFILWNQH